MFEISGLSLSTLHSALLATVLKAQWLSGHTDSDSWSSGLGNLRTIVYCIEMKSAF